MDPIPELIQQIDPQRLHDHLFYLADTLPRRTLNHTRPDQTDCTLYEVDTYIISHIETHGYTVEKEAVPVQALRPDLTRPMPHQFQRPEADDPWYTAYNLYAKKTGTRYPNEHIVIISHKDSQSWTPSPGAYDNAAGTIANMEMARVLADYEPQRSIWFVYCNEEHVPWTSEVVAKNMVDNGLVLKAALNVDSIGGKSDEVVAAGRQTNVTRYTTPEGKALTEHMLAINERYEIGLECGVFESERPKDDDGSFIKARLPAAVLNIGSYPYEDPNYHALGDTPDKVDIDHIRRSAQLSLAFVVEMDRQ
jgi:hypothetical protein